MKKIKFLSVFFLIMFMGITCVSAKTNTLNDVVTKIKASEMYSYLNSNGVTSTIASNNNSISITYVAQGKTSVTKLNFNNDIISYSFTGNKVNPSEDDLAMAFIDGIWIGTVASAVAELNGYTAEELEKIDDTEVEKFTLAENGMEVTMWNYKQESESGSASMTAYDTFKININKFKINKTNNNQSESKPPINDGKENNSNNTEETVENPSTGAFIPVLGLITLISLSVLCFYLAKKHKKFTSI